MSLTGPPANLPTPPGFLYPIHNLVYKEKRIMLDGYHFKNCAFVDCVLITNTGNFRIEECFVGIWWVNFGINATRIVKLTQMLDRNDWNPGLNPTFHENGGFSIL